MSETQSTCCPQCRSTLLKLLGGVIVATNPVNLTETPTIEDLREGQFSFSGAIIVVCEQCGQTCKLEDARAAAALPEVGYFYENTKYGTRVPIICSKCKNSSKFVRDVLEVKFIQEDISIDAGEASVVGTGSDEVVEERVTLSYECDECGHTIKLRDRDLVLK